MFRIKLSKPMAVLSAVMGVGMIIFALLNDDLNKNGGFLAFWIFAVIAIVAFNLWSAFANNGSVYNVERSDQK